MAQLFDSSGKNALSLTCSAVLLTQVEKPVCQPFCLGNGTAIDATTANAAIPTPTPLTPQFLNHWLIHTFKKLRSQR